MKIKVIHCFLVHPARHLDEPPDIGGTVVANDGKLYLMLESIFEKARDDCKTDISFNHCADGTQQNDCRDLLVAYVNRSGLDQAKRIAERLQKATTNRSGLGLMFLILGKEQHNAKLVLSRFPADQGILAEESRTSLTVEFLEKVFMKSATSYKAALYEGPVSSAGFWNGRAVDRQINNPTEIVAHYWIRDFLASDLRTTSAAGTKRLATALREVIHRVDDPAIKNEIAAAVTLAPRLAGRTLTIDQFCSRYSFSDGAKQEVRRTLKNDALMGESFQFDGDEFARFIAFRSIELDNGAVLTAQSTQFDRVFQQEALVAGGEEVRFTTQGRVIDQRLRKTKT